MQTVEEMWEVHSKALVGIEVASREGILVSPTKVAAGKGIPYL